MIIDEWKGEQKINEDRAWPLFSMSAYYEKDKPSDLKHELAPWQIEGMAEDRMKDHSSWHFRGFREWPNQNDLVEWSKKLWRGAIEKPRSELSRIANPENLSLIVTFGGWAVWWLSWFQHETFDVGLDDQEVLASFGRHCDREIIRAQREAQEPCLMGAEDRWRWSGSEPGGGLDCQSSPPCRCKFCKEAGVIRIGH